MTAPVWLRLTGANGDGLLLRASDVRAVYDSESVRGIRTGEETIEYVTDTLDAIAAALGAPLAAPAEVPAWRADAEAAVALLVRAGWADAQHDADAYATYVYASYDEGAVVTTTNVYRPGDDVDATHIAHRNNRTLTDCARLIIRDAVERGEAPDMEAARTMVAEWDAALGAQP